MFAKPKHLEVEYARQFQDSSVVTAYIHRPPYPDEVFSILSRLMAEEPRPVLDIGCGTGAIARPLTAIAARVDAVDFSAAMIAEGKRLPNGDAPNLHWIEGPIEQIALNPPYALITAGASLHWMDWNLVMPRLREALTPSGCLAIIEQVSSGWLPAEWQSELIRLISQYSTNRDYQNYDLIEELEKRHLFQQQGEQRTDPLPFSQSVEAYIESFHARNGLSRERMEKDRVAAFDTEVSKIVSPFAQEGQITLDITARVVWGLPAGPSEATSS